MPKIKELLNNNRKWADRMVNEDPDFFNRLVNQQKPEYLWIGCSDSRVPANQIVGMAPGELFVHRNVANQVVQTDFNCLSVIQYAVEALKVKHILVVGHYGCGGVAASMENTAHGLVDNWLFPIKDVYREHRKELENLAYDPRLDRLCELNVIEQVRNLAKSHTVQEAWNRGQPLTIHGWIYSVKDGLVRDLEVTMSDKEGVERIYHFDVADSE
ncbi:carbonate dehydratase [Aliidiomarina maris]|uniref:Carbonic anhydrase n=1 Tax=Aliidiomarina maris TaxID=531312 RepID=A0A327X3R5_9GAMM|nr:carbonate dehydratase [Aliidiomarina maris]MBA3989251.1 carbonate dehydratase [Idiomarina sp.]MCL5051448.1 carbonate dehydratase [Bacillota bacterium]RAK01780.1 carbonic anhydrase [Aliidiomarina maris]RUO28594.1 carbonate dehydratase [Aliidiomarina maris]